MYNFKTIFILPAVLFLAVVINSCTNDLNTTPLDKDITTSVSVYNTPQDYKEVLAKLYAGFAVTGQQGPAGNADIQGIDEGASSYIRQLYVSQEIPTDEAVIAWSDPGLPPFNYQKWTSSNGFVLGLYSRIYYEIALSNEFIRNAKGNNNKKVQEYNAEARFLRALSYWYALDLYGGGVPFVTEKNKVGSYLPEPISSDSLFNYIEGELKAIETELPDPGTNEYARADKAAAWTLLTKLYLNAEVYVGKDLYTQAITYAKKIIDQGGYTLESNYANLFRADNNMAKGIIFPIAFDGRNMKTYGGTTFLTHAPIGGSMDAANFGVDGGWAGLRTTPQFVDKFDVSNDSRAMFYTNGQTKSIDDIKNFKNGYAITKWKNLTSTGGQPSDLTYADIDFPVFRLADVYLMYAEAVLRGGSGGTTGQAVNLVNKIRERAYGNASGDINASQLDLDFILNERARELYWECHRRTDLIRFGRYTTADYLWAWKGKVQAGEATNKKYKRYPLPSSDVNANTNLSQNGEY